MVIDPPMAGFDFSAVLTRLKVASVASAVVPLKLMGEGFIFGQADLTVCVNNFEAGMMDNSIRNLVSPVHSIQSDSGTALRSLFTSRCRKLGGSTIFTVSCFTNSAQSSRAICYGWSPRTLFWHPSSESYCSIVGMWQPAVVDQDRFRRGVYSGPALVNDLDQFIEVWPASVSGTILPMFFEFGNSSAGRPAQRPVLVGWFATRPSNNPFQNPIGQGVSAGRIG